MIESEPGTMNAAPIPCAARMTMSVAASGASAQASEVPMNSAIPAEKMRLTPSTSPAAPPSSTSDARNSM